MIEVVGVAVALSVLPLIVAAALGALAYAVVGDRLTSPVAGIVLIEVSFLVVAAGYLMLFGDVTLSFDGFGTRELVLALAFVPVPFGLGLVTDRLAERFGVETESALDLSREALPVAVVLALVLVGPAEELLYRGVVQGLLVDSLGAVPGILVMAALFGAVHYPSYGADSPLNVDLGVAVGCLGTGVVGALFGVLYLATGSLFVPVVTHSLYDAALFVYLTVGHGDHPDGAVSS